MHESTWRKRLEKKEEKQAFLDREATRRHVERRRLVELGEGKKGIEEIVEKYDGIMRELDLESK